MYVLYVTENYFDHKLSLDYFPYLHVRTYSNRNMGEVTAAVFDNAIELQ